MGPGQSEGGNGLSGRLNKPRRKAQSNFGGDPCGFTTACHQFCLILALVIFICHIKSSIQVRASFRNVGSGLCKARNHRNQLGPWCAVLAWAGLVHRSAPVKPVLPATGFISRSSFPSSRKL